MATTELKDELDMAFTRRQWRGQRIGWALMLLVIVATVLGLFGTGPLGSIVETRDVGDAHYEVDHARFTRQLLVERIHVRVLAPSATGDDLEIAFSSDYASNNNIRGSTPDADGGGASADGATYRYEVSDWSQPVVVAFEVEARKPFSNPGVVTITAGDLDPVRMPLDAWVYP